MGFIVAVIFLIGCSSPSSLHKEEKKKGSISQNESPLDEDKPDIHLEQKIEVMDKKEQEFVLETSAKTDSVAKEDRTALDQSNEKPKKILITENQPKEEISKVKEQKQLVASQKENVKQVKEVPIKAEEKPKEETMSQEKLYKDGVYRGSGTGREGPIEVQVEIQGGEIQQITVLSHQDTENLAQTVFRRLTKDILSKQSIEVAVVSGATLTSEGYKEAIKNALKSAIK